VVEAVQKALGPTALSGSSVPAGGHARQQRNWEQPIRLWPQAMGAATAGPVMALPSCLTARARPEESRVGARAQERGSGVASRH
jgi:hypothetical protein